MSTTDLQGVVYTSIQTAAQPAATALGMTGMIPVDEANLGDFPWFWSNGTSFNAATFNWLNSLFAFNGDGYVGTNGTKLVTALYNVMSDISYVLSATDAAALNKAVLANQATADTVVTDWTTFSGPLPSTDTTLAQQLNYITSQVLLWGAPGLTLSQLRNSTNPMALLPNVPLGANQLVNDLMTYLAATSSVANIQAAVLANNNELNQVRANLDPQPMPATATAGYMTVVDDNGNSSVQVLINIAESVGNIQNKLLAAAGTGTSFSTTLTVTNGNSSQINVTSEGGVQGAGDLDGFFTFAGEGGASLNIFSADSSQTTCSITLTYNGCTTVTPSFAGYDITGGTGWWDPDPIEEAANGDPSQSGFAFSPIPQYDFSVNGSFGAIGRLMISQQPVITLTYSTSSSAEYEETWQSESSWGITFLGIPIAGGSSSFYQSETSYDATSETVTVTMTPTIDATPVSPLDQLANVVGAQILWPGAPTS